MLASSEGNGPRKLAAYAFAIVRKAFEDLRMRSVSDPRIRPLAELGLEAPHASQLVLGAPWGATLPATGAPGMYVLKDGTAWLRTDVEDDWHELVAGSVALLPAGSEHTLASRRDARTPPIAQFFAEHGGARGVDLQAGRSRAGNAHIDTFCFSLGSTNARQLLRAAPDLVVLPPAAGAAWTSHVARALSALLDCERRDLMVSIALAESLFAAALRDALARNPAEFRGADSTVTLAVALIHADLRRPWTVATLARQVGCSKSVLHDRFARGTGWSPMEYVTKTRMERAHELLRTTRDSIQDVVDAVGYDTASGFAVAFRRWRSRTPTAARRDPFP